MNSEEMFQRHAMMASGSGGNLTAGSPFTNNGNRVERATGGPGPDPLLKRYLKRFKQMGDYYTGPVHARRAKAQGYPEDYGKERFRQLAQTQVVTKKKITDPYQGYYYPPSPGIMGLFKRPGKIALPSGKGNPEGTTIQHDRVVTGAWGERMRVRGHKQAPVKPGPVLGTVGHEMAHAAHRVVPGVTQKEAKKFADPLENRIKEGNLIRRSPGAKPDTMYYGWNASAVKEGVAAGKLDSPHHDQDFGEIKADFDETRFYLHDAGIDSVTQDVELTPEVEKKLNEMRENEALDLSPRRTLERYDNETLIHLLNTVAQRGKRTGSNNLV